MTSFFYVGSTVRPFHSLLRSDFPSRWLQPLQCPLVSLLGVPDQVEGSLLQNWSRSWTSQSTRTLAVVTDMHRHTELSFVEEFHSLKKRMTERCSSLVHPARGPPSLHYYCAVVLHLCTILPPVGHSSNHQYHCCQLRRKSSCVSNFLSHF